MQCRSGLTGGAGIADGTYVSGRGRESPALTSSEHSSYGKHFEESLVIYTFFCLGKKKKLVWRRRNDLTWDSGNDDDNVV